MRTGLEHTAGARPGLRLVVFWVLGILALGAAVATLASPAQETPVRVKPNTPTQRISIQCQTGFLCLSGYMPNSFPARTRS